MLFLELIREFVTVGLLAFGGGPATLPFLFDICSRRPWFTRAQLIDMIAISQATPGPVGINMATLAGVNAAGVFGGVVSSASLALPSFLIVILFNRAIFSKKDTQIFKDVFSIIKATVCALFLNGIWNIASATLFKDAFVSLGNLRLEAVGISLSILALEIAVDTLLVKKGKHKAHPLVWVALGGLIGFIIF